MRRQPPARLRGGWLDVIRIAQRGPHLQAEHSSGVLRQRLIAASRGVHAIGGQVGLEIRVVISPAIKHMHGAGGRGFTDRPVEQRDSVVQVRAQALGNLAGQRDVRQGRHHNGWNPRMQFADCGVQPL